MMANTVLLDINQSFKPILLAEVVTMFLVIRLTTLKGNFVGNHVNISCGKVKDSLMTANTVLEKREKKTSIKSVLTIVRLTAWTNFYYIFLLVGSKYDV